MILGIEAINLIAGGGITHLMGILNNFDIENSKFEKIVIVAPQATLDKLNNKKGLQKITAPNLNKTVLHRYFFQIFQLRNHIKNVNLLFSPGGTYIHRGHRYISMSQNMLYYEKKERNRYFPSFNFARILLLSVLQKMSFRRSAGIIVSSNYAYNLINRLGMINVPYRIISHGTDFRFTNNPKPQKSIIEYSNNKPFKILYVSSIDMYKHQWNVVKAVGNLIRNGYPISIEFIGANLNKKASNLFNKALTDYGDLKDKIKYKSEVSYNEIETNYHSADLFIFASTCENPSIILLEAMVAGLPIISSNYGPMPEVLADGGVYFDPISVSDLTTKLENTINDVKLRSEISLRAFQLAKQYSWEKCSKDTFSFLEEFTKNK
jgi:glycosyltransferase involved in cell wall biosynthesis